MLRVSFHCVVLTLAAPKTVNSPFRKSSSSAAQVFYHPVGYLLINVILLKQAGKDCWGSLHDLKLLSKTIKNKKINGKTFSPTASSSAPLPQACVKSEVRLGRRRYLLSWAPKLDRMKRVGWIRHQGLENMA